MLLRKSSMIFLLLVVALDFCQSLEDLIAEESEPEPQISEPTKNDKSQKHSSKIRSSEGTFGLKSLHTPSSLDFRIDFESLRASAAGNGKGKNDDDDDKTLAQQVADGRYALIPNELFPKGSKRPGIISYLPNPEVPADTKENFGGLDKEEIWLAEDHVLVLRGGTFPLAVNDKNSTQWPPIDNYVAPPRQVTIPKNPKVPPPFPVQLKEDGPLEFIRGENGSLPPRPPFLPPFPFTSGGPSGNRTFPFPVPPGPLPPFLANLPPGAAFLPPPGNFTDVDEDDPSIYYPPKYDFFYPQDNTTAVPPGPLVPGIILPPPPNFFAPHKEEQPDDNENETDPEYRVTTKKPPFIGPSYLPSEVKPPKSRIQQKRPPSNKKSSITYIYPQRVKDKTTNPPGFTSPIYVPNSDLRSVYKQIPATTPRPYHISIPENQTLKQDIYIITTEPPEAFNVLSENIFDDHKQKAQTLDQISPDRHPLRSLIRPNVSVNYIGKVGHLPPSTPFPPIRDESPAHYTPPSGGHYITLPPTVTVTPIPVVKKIRVRPSTQNPQATFFFYEEPNPTEPTRQEENEVVISPIDQFLKENFKPSDIPEYDIKEVPAPIYVPTKTKSRQKIKSTYSPQEEPPKLNALEIDYSGLSGLHPYKSTEPPPLKPVRVTTPRPSHFQTPTTDSPFIPSNYYATANPVNMHFTPLDHSIIDDITMKYFTVFGQRLNNGVGTTPFSPVKASVVPTTTPRPKYTPTYSTEATFVPMTTPTPPPTPQQHYIKSTTAKPRPQSHFEQYLKEITGEDQNDYIVTQNLAPVSKTKKPKSHSVFSDPFYIPYRPSEISQYIEGIYRPSVSTTLRPVADVDLQPQYVPQISSTYRPFVSAQTQRPKPPSHNFGQYLQEVTSYGGRGPNTNSPSSHLEYFDASSHSAVRQPYKSQTQKPISLASDILINYRQPLHPINPDAEFVEPTRDPNPNIRVVQPPDLGDTRNRGPYRPFGQKPNLQPYDPNKAFFENIPNTGYFAQPTPNTANAFVSYNLPGNTGHFYFLTPQALDRSDSEGDANEHYGAVKRSDGSDIRSRGGRGDHSEDRSSFANGSRGSAGHTSQDYLRRRRKKS